MVIGGGLLGLEAAAGMAARGAGKVVNPHTFLSISASITQVNTIARELGKLDPANAKVYRHPTFFDVPDEVGHM